MFHESTLRRLLFHAGVCFCLPIIGGCGENKINTYKGVKWYRVDSSSIRICAGSKSGTLVSPKKTLSRLSVEFDLSEYYPELSTMDGIWIFDTTTKFPMIYINPKKNQVDKEIRQAIDIRDLDNEQERNRATTQLAATNFIYVGWAINSKADFDALKLAVFDRSTVNLNEDIRIEGRVLYRLKKGVQRLLVNGEATPAKVKAKASSIPVLFERPVKLGGEIKDFSVLFLDGSISDYSVDSEFYKKWKFLFDNP